MNKAELRIFHTKKRSNISPQKVQEASEMICEKIINSTQWKKAKTIILYEAIGQEVQTTHLLLEGMSENKKIYTTGNQENKYGLITFPKKQFVEEDISPDLIILPAVACGKDGTRLGRGGGYYDKLLEKHPKALSIALVYEEQVIDTIPMEEHDRKVNIVLTEKNTYKLS